MRQTWTAGAAGWVRNESLFDAQFAQITAAILVAAEIDPGHRMLDVGCGTGTLLDAGAAAGADVVGIDISPGMAAAAERRVRQARVIVGDAQTLDLLAAAPGKPFDRVLSRFGVMFFADPTAAFANIRRACAPDARMSFACWRGHDENPMFMLGTSVLGQRLDPPAQPPQPGAPGPVAFADRDRLLTLLTDAGWTSIDVEALDTELDYGIDGSDGVDGRLATILSTTTGRQAQEQLESRLGPEGWASLLDEVRAELRKHLVDGAVRIPAATWLVTATNC
jgi:SAM-dependent methyltransferase